MLTHLGSRAGEPLVDLGWYAAEEEPEAWTELEREWEMVCDLERVLAMLSDESFTTVGVKETVESGPDQALGKF